jgi:hypothetical protein
MKRTLYITLGVLGAALLIGAGIYLRARTAKTPEVVATPVNSGGLPTGGAFPVGGSTGSTNATSSAPLMQSQALDYAVRPDGSLLYLKTDGQIVAVTSVSSTILSTRKFTDILDGAFSFDGSRVIVKYGEGSSPRWSMYDVQKNSWRDLNIEARDVRWSPVDYHIAYFSRQLSNQNLNTWDLKLDTNRPKTLIKLNAEDLDLVWAGSNRIIFGERASAMTKGSLWSFDLAKNIMTNFIEEGSGLSLLWGEGGQGLLFAARTNGKGGVLTLIGKDARSNLDAPNNSTQTLSFLTLPEKCTFFTPSASSSTEEYLLCGIPRDTRTIGQSYLPDDYQKQLLVTEDNLYRIGTRTGSYIPVMDDIFKKIDATHLKVSGGKLYFINRNDLRVYSVALP